VTQPLADTDLHADPFVQFELWFEAAQATGQPLPEAFAMATATPEGEVSARMLLLKGFDRRGFVFFTNYNSRKSAQLHDNPRAALVFWWQALERQVRIEGVAVKVTEEESDAYFATRPRGSQIGAIASPQSQPLASRKQLEERVAEVSRAIGEGVAARPASWGGYRVVPDQVELWQGQTSRLHDRVRYRLVGGAWIRDRLAP